jgi:O-methyltransferase
MTNIESLPSTPNQAVREILGSSAFSSFLLSQLGVNGQQGFFSADLMMLCGRNMGFLKDQDFMAAFYSSLERYEIKSRKPLLRSLIWRKHVLASFGKNCLKLDGDFVECGVEYGFSVDVVSQYVKFGNVAKTYWLFDTFSGVPDNQLDQGTAPNPIEIDIDQFHAVTEKFAKFSNMRIIRGCLPDTFSLSIPDKIAFLHIDMNNSFAELATLASLVDKVVLGGHIILDDYGWTAFAKQHVCECEFFNLIGLNVVELPTGQGLVVKTTQTQAEKIDINALLRNCDTKRVLGSFWPNYKDKVTPNTDTQVEEFRFAVKYKADQINQLEAMFENSHIRHLVTKEMKGDLQCAKAFTVVEKDINQWLVTHTTTFNTSNLSILRSLLQWHIDKLQTGLDKVVSSLDNGGIG